MFLIVVNGSVYIIIIIIYLVEMRREICESRVRRNLRVENGEGISKGLG